MRFTSSQLRRPWHTCVALLSGVALAGAAPQAASAHDSLTLRFQKECPEGTWTCTGTLLTAHGKPIRDSRVSALIDSALPWNAAGVVGFSATETVSSSRGTFTMKHVGINVFSAEPPAIHVLGVVSEGTWDGRPLTGALLRIRAHGVPPSSVRGMIQIRPDLL